MYKLIFTRKFLKQIKKLDRNIQIRLDKAINRIRIRPEQFVGRLVGLPFYSLRAGDYRIILDIQKDKLTILILEVGHRRNIYK